MPTLTTHIAVAEKVCTKLKLKDKDLTVLGAAIVDWSNNFEIKSTPSLIFKIRRVREAKI